MQKTDFLYFDSKNELFKSPFGAVAEDTFVRLRLRLPKDCGVWFVFCRVFSDGKPVCDTEMKFEWCDGDSLYYKCDVKLPAGLYFYSFYYKTENEVFFINKSHEGKAVLGDGGGWQLTVFEKDFTTPNTFAGGVIYQIFPDRFCRSISQKPYIDGRTVRDDWGGTPAHTQKAGEVTLGSDYFCGDLRGIADKMDYIKNLGVTVIYLNPIFFAGSNHRYNTSDYTQIDPYLGDTQDFANLCKTAHSHGIKIILDGVFSHTGDDSVYFDKYGKYPNSVGAYQSTSSPYYNWYKFENWPDKYHSWWGIDTLPEVIEENEDYLEFICGENGILRRWLRLGADGWRLDVADELPDVFLDRLRTAVKAENPNAIIIGEVWEDASNKISYSVRRRYFLGKQLDSVMNYPFCDTIINYAKGGSAKDIANTVITIAENYPKQCLDLLMNHIGTHDTARILSVLGYGKDCGNRDNQATITLTDTERDLAFTRLKIATLLQYTLPGIPSLYYGDEAGLEGFYDPFCRGCYPWGKENHEILEHYTNLGKMRASLPVFADGAFKTLIADGGLFVFSRQNASDTVVIATNNENCTKTFDFLGISNYKSVFGKQINGNRITLQPYEFAVLVKLQDL